jgi:hypothetical protein
VETGLGAKKTSYLVSKRNRVSKLREWYVRKACLSPKVIAYWCVYVYITASKHEVKRVCKRLMYVVNYLQGEQTEEMRKAAPGRREFEMLDAFIQKARLAWRSSALQ